MKKFAKGPISIWWYTDDKEFWDFSVEEQNAAIDGCFLQYSIIKNHLNLWKEIVETFVSDASQRKDIYLKGYKSYERGRIILDLRTQRYKIICSRVLISDENFKKQCIEYFQLDAKRCDFGYCDHYSKQELIGNPVLDNFYYENQF